MCTYPGQPGPPARWPRTPGLVCSSGSNSTLSWVFAGDKVA
jgi:hypothetical protein